MHLSSFFCPLNVIEHRHKDDPVFETLRFYSLPCLVLLDLPEKDHCCKSLENCPVKFNLFSIKTRCVLVRRIPFEIFNVSSNLHRRLLDPVLLYPSIELSLRRHKLLPSPTQSLYRCKVLILSMRVTGNPGSSHSEFLPFVLWSISELFPNYLENFAQSGWLPSSTTSWTNPTPIRCSCKNPLRT